MILKKSKQPSFGNERSLIILLSFFGEFPWYFNYFLHSCRYNPAINFCIITDNDKIPNKPENVSLITITKKQFKNLATKKLGFSAALIQGYKICDFRPSLGYLFPELIKGYEFWGYGDIDMMYGDLRKFLTTEILDNYDVFSFRPEYMTGSFTVLRNTKKINTLFMQSRDYKTVLSQGEYFNFDECNFIFSPLQDEIPIDEIPCQIESFTHVVRKKEKEKYLRGYFDFNLVEGSAGKVKWRNGKIIYMNQFEAILYHFLKFKDRCKHNARLIPKNKNEIICFSQNNIYKRKLT
ncbi:MAG TPA: DUF6625 family protein [Hanamia sp.]